MPIDGLRKRGGLCICWQRRTRKCRVVAVFLERCTRRIPRDFWALIYFLAKHYCPQTGISALLSHGVFIEHWGKSEAHTHCQGNIWKTLSCQLLRTFCLKMRLIYCRAKLWQLIHLLGLKCEHKLSLVIMWIFTTILESPCKQLYRHNLQFPIACYLGHISHDGLIAPRKDEEKRKSCFLYLSK